MLIDNSNAKQRRALHVFDLELDTYGNGSPGYLVARLTPVEPGILQVEDWYLAQERNIGFIAKKGQLHVLWWLARPHVDVGPSPNPPRYTPWHNNGSPLELPDHNAYLAIGHQHDKGRTLAYFGERYFHFFVLFSKEVPHNVLQTSHSFCFPSAHNRSLCEFVQF